MTGFLSGRRGTSFIDLMVSMGIISVLFGGIYLVYFSIITSIANISVRAAATAAVQAEIETIRNLPYDSVGTVGGVPVGVIQQLQAVTVGNYSFTLQTTVRNIDDPFDGTVNGTPPDTAPADYKLVSIIATCPLCSNYVSVGMTTTVAPKNLESATQNGSLFISAIDANGFAVTDASVHIVNASVTPSINFTDITNTSGILQLVGVPTSTQGYQITVTKTGYSTDQTYPKGVIANPVKPNATVAVQKVTSISFAIDKTSSITVYSSDNRCVAVPNATFLLQGAKLIGTNPNVLKFSTTTTTGASGSVTMPNIEWDSYAFSLSDATKNLMGTIPLNPLVVNPNSATTFRLITQTIANPSLLVTAIDAATKIGISNAAINVSKSGFSQTLTTGHAFVMQTDWSGGQYAAQSGGLDVNSLPGAVTMLKNASGTYDTGTTEWLISNTFDLGGSNSTFYSLSWDPTSQQSSASLQFQIAANNDNATWNFVGPDGTAASYFTASPGSLPALLSGNRYVRYKAYFGTQNKNITPELDDVSIEFFADCVPPAQVLFVGLAQATYTVTVNANNYYVASTTVSVGSGSTSTIISLTHI